MGPGLGFRNDGVDRAAAPRAAVSDAAGDAGKADFKAGARRIGEDESDIESMAQLASDGEEAFGRLDGKDLINLGEGSPEVGKPGGREDGDAGVGAPGLDGADGRG